MRILITGIPGSGKTTIGEYLKNNFNYFHMDMESDENLGYLKIEKMLDNPVEFIEEFINKFSNIVITWGFIPGDRHIEIINMLKKDYNFMLIWFDGDRKSAKNAFIRRSKKKGEKYFKIAMEELNLQIPSINNSNVIERINPIIINTFDDNQNFKNSEEVIKEILAIR